MKKLVKKIFNHFFWAQHPEAAIRYAPIISEIKKRNLQDAKILEVGPGSLGIVPYLKRKIDGVDIDFSGPQTELLNKIKATGVELKFRKNSYDVVLSADVLEHLKGQERTKSIAEMMRVAKKLVLIAAPIGELSQAQDRQLKRRWDSFFKEKNLFLTEHVQNGLPKSDDVLVTIDKEARKLGKKFKVTSYPNLNLRVRKILMQTWITKSKLMYYLYLKGYLVFLPLLKRANFGACYRRVFVIEFQQ